MADALREAGNQLANLAFNWAQQPGYTLTSDDVALLDKLRRQWDDARAALAAPPGWQPIETAPKDGGLFLCWVSAVRYGETDEGQQYQQDASQVDVCSWRDGPSDLPGHGYFDPCCGQIADSQDVTHWMPLPAAPVAAAPDAQKGEP